MAISGLLLGKAFYFFQAAYFYGFEKVVQRKCKNFHKRWNFLKNQVSLTYPLVIPFNLD